MYCTSCGKQIADIAAFCPYCGKPTPQQGGDALAKLVAAARMGDQSAVSALYEKTYSKVYYTVKSMIKDEGAVFDIVQDSYIKAFAHLDSFQGNEKFLPWVRQIAANTARDWLKKKRPMLFADLSLDDGRDTPVEELFPDERRDNLPEQVIDQKETKRLIREIIGELPEDQRAAIGMFYYQEMSVKEIAAAMGVSESAVKSRLMYGRNKIEKKVRELEMQGTKLYSLAPIPFLLLLFHNQKVYATEVPDSRILHAILEPQPVDTVPQPVDTVPQPVDTVSQPMDTVSQPVDTVPQPTDTSSAVGAAQGAGTGTAGGFGALKIGFIVLAAAAIAGIGFFGATRFASRFAESQEASTMEGVVAEENSEESEAESGFMDEATEEADPIEEALEQYRSIVEQADSYDYGEYAEANEPWLEFLGYRYTLVRMKPEDSVPSLLLEKVIMDTELSAFTGYLRVFRYDPDAKNVRLFTEVIVESERYGGLYLPEDGYGIVSLEWTRETDETSVSRILQEEDFLFQDTYWSGQIYEMPEASTFIEIEWHEDGDLSALDSWTAPDMSEAALSETETQMKNESTSLLSDYVGTYTPYETFHDDYGGGERLRDITLTESGMVTGGGTSWSTIDINGLEPSEILQNTDGSIKITFSGNTAIYMVYPAGVVPKGYACRYTDDYWQGVLDLNKAHILYLNIDGGVMEVLYHN